MKLQIVGLELVWLDELEAVVKVRCCGYGEPMLPKFEFTLPYDHEKTRYRIGQKIGIVVTP